MVKRKSAKKVVGSKNIVRTAIPKELNNIILQIRVELNASSKKPVSKQWAALTLAKRYNKK